MTLEPQGIGTGAVAALSAALIALTAVATKLADMALGKKRNGHGCKASGACSESRWTMAEHALSEVSKRSAHTLRKTEAIHELVTRTDDRGAPLLLSRDDLREEVQALTEETRALVRSLDRHMEQEHATQELLANVLKVLAAKA